MVVLGSPFAYVIATAEPQNTTRGPAFNSVEIRAAAPNTMPQMRSRFGNGRYELYNATAVDLIRTAWGVDADSVSGGPDWLDLNHYDVIAMAPVMTMPDMLKTMLFEDKVPAVLDLGNGVEARQAHLAAFFLVSVLPVN